MATELGQLIRDARHRSGMTLEDVAEKVGITPGALSHIESGRRLPQSYNAVAIAEVLNVPREEMLRALDDEHSHRRRSSADRPPAASHAGSWDANPSSPQTAFSARPIGDLFGEEPSHLRAVDTRRAYPNLSRQLSGSSRDLARWSDDRGPAVARARTARRLGRRGDSHAARSGGRRGPRDQPRGPPSASRVGREAARGVEHRRPSDETRLPSDPRGRVVCRRVSAVRPTPQEWSPTSPSWHRCDPSESSASSWSHRVR